MAATYQLVSKRLGQGGDTNDKEIKRIRRLLRRCGYDLGHNPENPKWDDTVQAALMHFQTYWREGVCLNTDPTLVKQFIGKSSGQGHYLPVRPYIDPEDKVVWALAENAGVLFSVCSNKRGAAAFTYVHDWLVAQGTPYGGYGAKANGPSHMVFGLQGHPSWAIQVETNSMNVLPKEWRRCLHCTSYANLMLSVWTMGNCHGAPYSSNLGFGGTGKSLANSRYGYSRCSPTKGRLTIKTWTELQSVLQPGRLYAMELCRDSDLDGDGVMEDFVYHYTLIYNNFVYQANLPVSKGVYSTSLDQWWSNKKATKSLFLYGPSPT